jgi:cell division ATPase FtsA
MSDSLGLSIGMTNLVAARIGRAPVMRRSVLTLFNDRASEVGVPSENPNPNQPGLVLSGFVERVGDPVPLVAADGSPHRGERVLVEALEAMARTVGGGAPIAIAVPAHWGPTTVGALRGALRAKPSLAPNGVPAALIPDSVAALAALQTAPGLPSSGVVTLVDLGGSGTSITLADAGSNLDQIGETVRYPDFSGDQIDQALLNHVLAGVADANNADPTGTLGLGSLARLRDDARQAKERLSAGTATVVPVELPGYNSDVRITRNELENLISEPLAGLLNTIEETLQRNNIPVSNVSAVATVGGGANIPRVTQQLSERLRAPVVTTPQSQLNTAAGAALVADRGLAADAPTGMAAAADTPTSMAAAGWAAGAAGLAASESASDGAASATFRALAWSQGDSPGGELVPYSGEDYTFDQGPTDARPQVAFAHEEEGYEPEPGPLPWYKRPAILFGAAAAGVLLAIGGLAITLTSTSGTSGPVTETATQVETGPSPEQPPTSQAPQTITVTGPNGEPSTTVVPAPPPPSPTTTSPTSTTTTATTTTPTTTTTTTTTTTPPTTTTTQPVTTTTQPVTTTTQPVTTTTQPVTTTTAAALSPVTTTQP